MKLQSGTGFITKLQTVEGEPVPGRTTLCHSEIQRMTANGLRSKLAEHPRLIGALFALTLLVSQAGTTLAAETGCGAYHGP